MKFNKRKVRNKIAYSKNAASAKSISTHTTKEEGKIYNIYNHIIYIYIHTHIHIHIHLHTHIHVYIYTYIYCIHMHIHIHTNTYIRIYVVVYVRREGTTCKI